MRNLFLSISIILLVFGCNSNIASQTLETNFKNPPASAKPKTWMHAMSSNMTKEGMTKDLQAIEKGGIGGLLLFNIAQGIPNGPVKYNSDEHHEIVEHAAAECERLGLSFGVHNCDGWTSSGGPWITPEQSMKMLVWSEIIVEGEELVELQLEQPFTRRDFYKDVAVLAYPYLESEKADFNSNPIITSSDENFNVSLATDFLFRIISITLISKIKNKEFHLSSGFVG